MCKLYNLKMYSLQALHIKHLFILFQVFKHLGFKVVNQCDLRNEIRQTLQTRIYIAQGKTHFEMDEQTHN